MTAYIPDEQAWESPPTRRRKPNQTVPGCGEHHVAKEWKTTTFVYDDDGVSIEVPNVHAWVCPIDGEASVTPDTTNELIETVRPYQTCQAGSRTSLYADRVHRSRCLTHSFVEILCGSATASKMVSLVAGVYKSSSEGQTL